MEIKEWRKLLQVDIAAVLNAHSCLLLFCSLILSFKLAVADTR